MTWFMEQSGSVPRGFMALIVANISVITDTDYGLLPNGNKVPPKTS